MQTDIFTLFIGDSMAIVDMQTDVWNILGNYNILALLCECKIHELRNFKFSENLRPK